MTVWIVPEFDRELWAVCLFWLQGGKHDEALTDKSLACSSPRGGRLDPPPFGGEGDQQNPRAYSITH